jgi:NAD(P)-dependent dehydrogenase (short-subunit alcohol dehydrogenase family)
MKHLDGKICVITGAAARIDVLFNNAGIADPNDGSVLETSVDVWNRVSKGGVLSMSREMGVEFAKRGIRVNALCPGPVETPLLQTVFSPEQAARRLVHLPNGRFAQASEIAEAAAFLASNAASYINASEFLVDGGITAAYVTSEDIS